MLPGAGWWCVTRASGSTSPRTSGSPRSSPPPGPRRGSAASPSTRYLHSYLQYLQYLSIQCIYNIYTVYLQYLYSLSTLYIAMKYFSKYCIYLYNGTDQTSVKGSLTVHWSNDPMNHFVALPHRTKINQLRKESNRNNIKTIQLPRIKIHVLNRSSEYKDVPTQFTETEMSGWKCDNSFKVPRRL